MWRATSLLLISSCSYAPGVAPAVGDDATLDSSSQDVVDVLECVWTFVPDIVGDQCSQPTPTTGLVLTPGAWGYDTDTGTLTDPGSGTSEPQSTLISGTPPLRVVTLTGFEIQATANLEVRGLASLAFVIHGAATIDGTLDLSARSQAGGPGGDDATACATGFGANGVNATNSDGGGGGGGGSYGGTGGTGGRGGGGPAALGGAGGVASEIGLAALRGGCRGGSGGASTAAGGLGGGGGGAAMIAASTTITVSGGARIQSSGGAAAVAGANGGGGGGGSGGAIVLEAPAIDLTGLLCANGGGGSEGSADGAVGGLGQSGLCSTTEPAVGGSGGLTLGSDGGDGGVGATSAEDGQNNTNDDGGGGAGGSVGRLYLRGTQTGGGGMSPPPLRLDL